MSGLVVQTGPWKNSKTSISIDKVWSGGGVPTGGRQHAGHGNWRQVMTPGQNSGFTPDSGFAKPSPYAIPSIVQKRLKQPTQKPVKEKVNYLKIIATTLKEQQDLAMKQAGYGAPPPQLPQPAPSDSVKNLLGQAPPSVMPGLLQVSPTVSIQSADPSVFSLAAAEAVPSMPGGFFNSALFKMGLADFKHQPNKLQKTESPKTGLRPPSASEIQNALGNLRGTPSPRGFQPAANPFLTELKAKAEIVQNRQGSMDTDGPTGLNDTEQGRLAVLLKNYMDATTAPASRNTTPPSSRRSSVSTTDLQNRLAEHLNTPQWVTNPVYDKTPIGIIGGGKITKNESPADILRKTFTAEASASKRYGK